MAYCSKVANHVLYLHGVILYCLGKKVFFCIELISRTHFLNFIINYSRSIFNSMIITFVGHDFLKSTYFLSVVSNNKLEYPTIDN